MVEISALTIKAVHGGVMMKIPVLIDIEKAIRKLRNKVRIFKDNFIYMNGVRIYKSPKNVEFDIKGINNTCLLNKFIGHGKLKIRMDGNNCLFEMGKGNRINNGFDIAFPTSGFKIPEKSKIIIGNDNFINGYVSILVPMHEDKYVKIGNNNLFAGNICIRGISEHLIYDIKTKKRLNDEKNIIIGDKIWICSSVRVLNKARIPSNSVIAKNSIVNKAFEQENVLLAGAPAQIKKEGIMWHIGVDNSYLYTDNPLKKAETPCAATITGGGGCNG
jgi:acetyltransferase-like isoleucine patch superfamily enzyme